MVGGAIQLDQVTQMGSLNYLRSGLVQDGIDPEDLQAFTQCS